jgi:hypothetical protein
MEVFSQDQYFEISFTISVEISMGYHYFSKNNSQYLFSTDQSAFGSKDQ